MSCDFRACLRGDFQADEYTGIEVEEGVDWWVLEGRVVVYGVVSTPRCLSVNFWRRRCCTPQASTARQTSGREKRALRGMAYRQPEALQASSHIVTQRTTTDSFFPSPPLTGQTAGREEVDGTETNTSNLLPSRLPVTVLFQCCDVAVKRPSMASHSLTDCGFLFARSHFLPRCVTYLQFINPLSTSTK